jgi:hypothetical protein
LKLDKQRQSYGSYDKLGSVVDWGVPIKNLTGIFLAPLNPFYFWFSLYNRD